MRARTGGVFVGVFAFAITAKALTGILDLGGGEEASASSSSARLNGEPASDKQLDSWIRQALVVMEQENIPGTYQGIYKNVIRESGGNPNAVNTWDVNAKNGVPSRGLLQVIPPTFEAHKLPQSAYDRAGIKADANDLTDPVANLVTACAYAWSRYPGKGGIDGINGAY